jgi:hypothetical protein
VKNVAVGGCNNAGSSNNGTNGGGGGRWMVAGVRISHFYRRYYHYHQHHNYGLSLYRPPSRCETLPAMTSLSDICRVSPVLFAEDVENTGSGRILNLTEMTIRVAWWNGKEGKR